MHRGRVMCIRSDMSSLNVYQIQIFLTSSTLKQKDIENKLNISSQLVSAIIKTRWGSHIINGQNNTFNGPTSSRKE